MAYSYKRNRLATVGEKARIGRLHLLTSVAKVQVAVSHSQKCKACDADLLRVGSAVTASSGRLCPECAATWWELKRSGQLA